MPGVHFTTDSWPLQTRPGCHAEGVYFRFLGNLPLDRTLCRTWLRSCSWHTGFCRFQPDWETRSWHRWDCPYVIPKLEIHPAEAAHPSLMKSCSCLHHLRLCAIMRSRSGAIPERRGLSSGHRRAHIADTTGEQITEMPVGRGTAPNRQCLARHAKAARCLSGYSLVISAGRQRCAARNLAGSKTSSSVALHP